MKSVQCKSFVFLNEIYISITFDVLSNKCVLHNALVLFQNGLELANVVVLISTF